jgi:hypothetical protein
MIIATSYSYYNMRSQQLLSLLEITALVSGIWVLVGCSSVRYGVEHYSKDITIPFGQTFEIPEKRDSGIPTITLTPLRYNADRRACLFRADYDGSRNSVEKWVEGSNSFRELPLMESLRLDFVSANETGAILRVYGARPIR